ncbi:NADH:flavin oxidoreductase/NADH oxidase family protein [Alterisphingorhabdus coralli]|uniref:NADH:flavin oxidoreductase/NADH oxidase family protein n=1 Tax=Alterisphingorhabdus coralli TaxID=3071408 RepID=A0AA97F777_9SPHN|nr:NADH:flavin oxidoreductase/NADH oxidase family protein [Parasphingorhabdus sp. SCSIO 66989]WOE75238.1 NADH:flavin oxidoreductase/NADH oxidase family protein [Parasphingorhabdus sp. SCSIO 66989]
MAVTLDSPLTLPNGAVIPNRIAKAAMTEGLARPDGVPTEALEQLYGHWSQGGAGVLISGNIMIDPDHLERPGNVIIAGKSIDDALPALTRWAKAATANGNHFWAQLSHSGRQTTKLVNPNPKAPSAVKLGLPGGQFGTPEALTLEEIGDVVDGFAATAAVTKEAGFTGVQIHAAHGYLLSSFLSPRSNIRDDDYGGSLENRARILLETVGKVRASVGKEFTIAVKLNSADFQRGGFAFEDSLQVAQWLANAGVDLLEISGGTYEQPKLLGVEGVEAEEPQNVAPSTAKREAYFVDFAKAMQETVSVPLMVTGGFRTRVAMDYALESGAADMIGLGRPMCVMPDAPKQLLEGTIDHLPSPEGELRLLPSWLSWLRAFQLIKTVDTFAVQYWFYGQIYALAETGAMDPSLTPFQAFRMVEDRNKQLMAERNRIRG